MFGQLQDKFSKIFKVIRGHGKVSENNISDAIREIRIALLESDVNYKVVKAFIEKVKVSAAGTKVFDSVRMKERNADMNIATEYAPLHSFAIQTPPIVCVVKSS